MARVRIAIPEPTSNDPEYNRRSFPQYVAAIEAAGGEAVPIPLGLGLKAIAERAAGCSGVLLPGSPADVDPHRYSQDPLPACAARDEAREAADDLLLSEAAELGKPLFGICFGMQSLNVWRGGSLVQDLPHGQAFVDHQPGREVLDAHRVVVFPDTRLSSLLSPEESVNSSHHQAVAEPGRDLKVAARSQGDQVVEAIEGEDPAIFLVGVQWHPERSYLQSAASRALFASFLHAAEQWQGSQLPFQQN